MIILAKALEIVGWGCRLLFVDVEFELLVLADRV